MTVAINPKFQSVMQKFEERAKNVVAEPSSVAPAKLQPKPVLPYWEPESCGAPNAFLRGALFSATQGRNRRMCEREIVAALEGYEIRYTGIQLTQADLSLWEALLNLARSNPLGEEASFTAYEILKQLGKGTSKTDYESLKKALARLRSADVEITVKGDKTYFGPLCGISGELDEKTDQYRFRFSGGLMMLFGSGWSKLDFEQRLEIKGKPLALWLHGLYSSHASPYPMKVETIHKLCGSETTSMRVFKQLLKKAHEDLIAVGLLKSFEIENDTVTVKKKPSRSQAKHLKATNGGREK